MSYQIRENKTLTKSAVMLLSVWSVITLTPLAFTQSVQAQIETEDPKNNNGKSDDNRSAGQMAAGTVNLSTAARNFLNENINVTFFDALDLAQLQVANGTVIEAHLDAVQGYFVYNVTVADLAHEMSYRVYIDTMNGKVLSNSKEGRPLFSLGARGNSANHANVNASLLDAADVAEDQIQNSTAIAGSFEVVAGLHNPVYKITLFVIDSGALYKVYVDTVTGRVMYLPEEMSAGELLIRGVF